MPDTAALDESALLDGLREVGVVPVVTIDDPGKSFALASALASGGLRYVEITLRTSAALESLSAARGAGAVLGAGTVTTAQEAAQAIEAGAQFVVSPGLDEGVVRYCRDQGVPVIPGVATPTEVMAARALGLRALKVFPVGSLGGPGFVRSLAAVWPDMVFMPTGGVTQEVAPQYLSLASVLAVGGSWMVPPALLSVHAWDDVETAARTAARLRGTS